MPTIRDIAAELDMTTTDLTAKLGIKEYHEDDSLWKHGFTIEEVVEALTVA